MRPMRSPSQPPASVPTAPAAVKAVSAAAPWKVLPCRSRVMRSESIDSTVTYGIDQPTMVATSRLKARQSLCGFSTWARACAARAAVAACWAAALRRALAATHTTPIATAGMPSR
ncbi:hypothetical protein D3C86_632470 [compost metagenome]